MQRLARAVLSVVLVGSAILTTSIASTIAGITAGAGLGGLGAVVAIRVVRLGRQRRMFTIR